MNDSAIFLDIRNRQHLFGLLQKLEPGTRPAFGLMQARHMVEHLDWVLGFAGRYPQQLHLPAEKAAAIKQHVVYSPWPLAPFKAPVMPQNTLVPLVHADLQAAIDALKKGLDDFDAFFARYPQSRPISPVMGEMDHAEWMVFHNKHFTHHFRQFYLL